MAFIFVAALWITAPVAAQDVAAVDVSSEGGIDYWCRTKEDKSYFIYGACADVLRAAAASVAMVNWAMIGQGPCSDEMQEAVGRLSWFYGVFRVRVLDMMMFAYQDFVEKSLPVQEGLESMLLHQDERMLASALIRTFKHERVTPMYKDVNQLVLPDTSEKDAAHLYRSCQEAIKEPQTPESRRAEAFCDATISGIWIGYALVQETLLSYTLKEGACAARISGNILAGVQQRLDHTIACAAPHRKTNKEIAALYVLDVDSLPPDAKTSMQKEPAVLGMIGTISRICMK
jgi:hypothetical protein